MSPMLTKRPFADYTQVVQDDVLSKKIRCVLRSSDVKCVNLQLLEKINSKKSNSEILEVLLEVANLPHYQEEEIPDITKKLSEIFRNDVASHVKVVILNILADIGCLPYLNSQLLHTLIDEVIFLVKREKSRSVKCQGLVTLSKITNSIEQPKESICWKLVDLATNMLQGYHTSVKYRCLDLISELLPVNDSSNEVKNVQRNISEYIHSEDCRTRTAAFKALITLHNRGLNIDSSIYKRLLTTLNDDCDEVRQMTIRLICLAGQTYPENVINLGGAESEPMRLIDDAFSRVCRKISDRSKLVRIEAASLVGTMSLVSLGCLKQTLDRKIMSNMKKKRSAREKAWSYITRGEWEFNKVWSNDKPMEKISTDDVSLIGACGAFVQGLEDEFLEVRSVAVKSMCSLSLANSQFATQSLDFLADMLNDEIHEVRLIAIDCVADMSDTIELRLDQLEIIFSVLEDSSVVVREGLHTILSQSGFASTECLQMCVKTLLENLMRYPGDRKSIWNCFQKMGDKHSSLTLPLVPELLMIHPFFDTTESNVEDPAYVAILLLVFNAAKNCCTMLELFEEKTIKHYSYLRDTMPHLVPFLPISGNLTSCELKPISPATPQFLDFIFKQIDNAQNTRVRLSLLEVAEKDLSRLALIDSTVSGCAQFSSLYISSQLAMARLIKNRMWYSNSAPTHQANLVKTAIGQLLQNALKLQFVFTGLNETDVAAIKQFKLKALALLLVYVVRATNHSARALSLHFLAQVDDTKEFLTEENIQPEGFTHLVFKELAQLEETKPGTVARMLLPLLENSVPSSPPVPNTKINMCTATINEPTGGPDMVYSFIAGLAMGVKVEAELHHLNTSKPLRLKLKYPDQQIHLIVPKSDDLKPIRYATTGEKCDLYRLVTTALVSHQVWSEPSYVELSIALDLSDKEGTLSHCMQPTSLLCVIDLCPPIKLYISPKSSRKGVV